MGDLSNPLTRIESYLAGIAGVLEAVPEPPLTRIEEYLKACYENLSGVAQTAAENLAAEYDPEGTYTAGDYVTYEGMLYKALADSADPAGDWVPEDWDAVQVMNEVSGGGGGGGSSWEDVPEESLTYNEVVTDHCIKVEIDRNLKLLHAEGVLVVNKAADVGSLIPLVTIADSDFTGLPGSDTLLISAPIQFHTTITSPTIAAVATAGTGTKRISFRARTAATISITFQAQEAASSGNYLIFMFTASLPYGAYEEVTP